MAPVGIAVNCRGDFPELLRNDGAHCEIIGSRCFLSAPNRTAMASAPSSSSPPGDFVRVDQAKGGTSYMSASDPRIHFGLGKRTKVDSLVITWPSGQVDQLTNVPVDSIIAVKEGVGIVPHPFPKVTPR